MKAQPIQTVLAYLCKKRDDLNYLIQDGMPVVNLPGKTKPAKKVFMYALYNWLKSNCTGGFMTYDQFIHEYKQFIESRSEKIKEKSNAKATK